MSSVLPPGTQLSPDGRWYWDGTRWAPVQAAPPPIAAYPAGAYLYAPRTNSLAIASLVTGILSWVLCPFLAAVLAIIFGHVSRNQVKQSGEGGGGMALAGLILGYTNIGLSAVFIVFYVLFAG
ncbi:MAG TPA: DUF4190 domain-containing protein, partial [Candidatus Dormibacteraeota bacterium]|nr:DUF4190 domain-containing protein [Candidatus Dormibacteraeota bacterium]